MTIGGSPLIAAHELTKTYRLGGEGNGAGDSAETEVRALRGVTLENNLVLAPITVVVVSDGVPDVRDGSVKSGSPDSYRQIDLSPLDYLSKNVTVRLVYASPKVGDNWRKLVKRDRVRFWVVENEVMRGWRAQMKPDTELANQDRFWKWVKDNVDYRVRRGV